MMSDMVFTEPCRNTVRLTGIVKGNGCKANNGYTLYHVCVVRDIVDANEFTLDTFQIDRHIILVKETTKLHEGEIVEVCGKYGKAENIIPETFNGGGFHYACPICGAKQAEKQNFYVIMVESVQNFGFDGTYANGIELLRTALKAGIAYDNITIYDVPFDGTFVRVQDNGEYTVAYQTSQSWLYAIYMSSEKPYNLKTFGAQKTEKGLIKYARGKIAMLQECDDYFWCQQCGMHTSISKTQPIVILTQKPDIVCA